MGQERGHPLLTVCRLGLGREGWRVRENQITLLNKERAAGTVLWPFWRKMAFGAQVVEGGADGEEKRHPEKTCRQTPRKAGQPTRPAAGSAKGPEGCDVGLLQSALSIQGKWTGSRRPPPTDTRIHGCSSPSYKMLRYLHITIHTFTFI